MGKLTFVHCPILWRNKGEWRGIQDSKQGCITLEELSNPRSKHYVKSGMAIPPGEPADLVRNDWIPIYKKLGRDRTIELVKNGIDLKEAKKIIKDKQNEKENQKNR